MSSDLHRMTINQRARLSLCLSSWKRKDMPLVFWIRWIYRVAHSHPLPHPHPLPLFSVPMPLPKNVSILLFADVYSVVCFLFIPCSIFRNIIHPHHFTTIASLRAMTTTTTNWQYRIQHTIARIHISHTYSVFTDKVFDPMRIYQLDMDMCVQWQKRWRGRKKEKKSNPKRISTIHASFPLLVRCHRFAYSCSIISLLVAVTCLFRQKFSYIFTGLLFNRYIWSKRMDDFYLKFCLRSIYHSRRFLSLPLRIQNYGWNTFPFAIC